MNSPQFYKYPAGVDYKSRLIAYLLGKGYEVVNFGTDSTQSCDYPDFAHPLGCAVENGEVDAGTLDPLATGLLLICIGEATKRAESLQASAKEYIAGITFGAVTASYDLEKDIDRLCPLDGVSEESLRALLPSFVGEQMQFAPLFSAKSVDGVRAYETARKLYRQGRLEDGSDLISANRIEIYGLELLSFGVEPFEPFAPPAEAEGRNCSTSSTEIAEMGVPLRKTGKSRSG